METTYAYLAGAIDADGFISIGRRKGSRQRLDGTDPVYYVVRLGLGETSPVIPDLLQAVWPAWRGEHRPKNPDHKTVHVWQACNAKAADALVVLIPHLRLKKTQAELALQLARLIASQNAGRSMKGPLDTAQTAAREALYRRVTELNGPRNRRVHF